jgi:hypothetical protein
MKTRWILLSAATILLSACQASSTPSPVSLPDTSLKTEAPPETIRLPDPTNTPIPPTETPVTAGTTVTQAEDIQGIWTITTHPHYKNAYWLIQEDGTYKFSPNADGGRPSESGKYWFEVGLFFVTDDFCPKPGRYEVRKTGGPDTELSIKLVEDACSARIKILTGAVATWYRPLQ